MPVRWFRSFAVVLAAPYGCGLGVDGLGEFTDADDAADAAGEAGIGPNGDDGGSGNDTSPGVPDCPAGLQDQVTACTPASPDCAKACGPELADGGSLGSAACSCDPSTSAYTCGICLYPAPLPPCYALGDLPPTCPAKAATGMPCPKACDGANPGATPPCAFVTNGKVEGCQCIQKTGATKPAWTCAPRW